MSCRREKGRIPGIVLKETLPEEQGRTSPGGSWERSGVFNGRNRAQVFSGVKRNQALPIPSIHRTPDQTLAKGG